LWSLYYQQLAIFRIAAGKTVGPVEHDATLSKSVIDAAVVEHPAQSVGELSGEAGLEAREALWSLFSPHHARFCFAAGKTVGPEEHDATLSKSVIDAAVVERPAQSVGQLAGWRSRP
jgi:hypothetical protein